MRRPRSALAEATHCVGLRRVQRLALRLLEFGEVLNGPGFHLGAPPESEIGLATVERRALLFSFLDKKGRQLPPLLLRETPIGLASDSRARKDT